MILSRFCTKNDKKALEKYLTPLKHRNSDEITRWVALSTCLKFLRMNEWIELKTSLIKYL